MRIALFFSFKNLSYSSELNQTIESLDNCVRNDEIIIKEQRDLGGSGSLAGIETESGISEEPGTLEESCGDNSFSD